MDLRTVLTISTLLLMTPGSGHAIPVNGLETSTTALNSNTTSSCPCPSAPICSTPPTPTPCPTYRPPAPTISFLTISWKDCAGNVELKNASSFSSSVHVCYDSLAVVKNLLGNVCTNKKGCEGESVWSNHRETRGYSIKVGGVMEENEKCITLKVQCKVEGQGQLQAYKVVIALLCCVLIVLLLIRFTKPTVKALQKRLSDRRQSRWIGPTQSHSVSYHRGKTAVKNNDGEKRLSYPALERLTVSNSREPSSNRNSDCNY